MAFDFPFLADGLVPELNLPDCVPFPFMTQKEADVTPTDVPDAAMPTTESKEVITTLSDTARAPSEPDAIVPLPAESSTINKPVQYTTQDTLIECGRIILHIIPDEKQLRPQKIKSSPLTFVFMPSESESHFPPIRVRLRPQGLRSFCNIANKSSVCSSLFGLAPPLDPLDSDPIHFLHFALAALDGKTRLAGPLKSNIGGPLQSARRRQKIRFKHSGNLISLLFKNQRKKDCACIDYAKDYQAFIELDLGVVGPGALLQLQLYSTAPNIPRYTIVPSECIHKFARVVYSNNLIV